MIELHSHTTRSDGELIPAELLRRAEVAGVEAICTAAKPPSACCMVPD